MSMYGFSMSWANCRGYSYHISGPYDFQCKHVSKLKHIRSAESIYVYNTFDPAIAHVQQCILEPILSAHTLIYTHYAKAAPGMTSVQMCNKSVHANHVHIYKYA